MSFMQKGNFRNLEIVKLTTTQHFMKYFIQRFQENYSAKKNAFLKRKHPNLSAQMFDITLKLPFLFPLQRFRGLSSFENPFTLKIL